MGSGTQLILIFIVTPIALVAVAELVRVKIRGHFEKRRNRDWERRLALEQERLNTIEQHLLEQRAALAPQPPPPPITLFRYQNEPGFIDGVIVEHVPPEPPNFPRADRIRLTLVNENNSGVGGYGQVWTEPEHLRLIGLGLVRAADHFGSPTPPPSPQPVRQALRSVWARLRNPDV